MQAPSYCASKKHARSLVSVLMAVCMLGACAHQTATPQSVRPASTPNVSGQPLRFIARLDNAALVNEASFENLKTRLVALSIGVSIVSQLPGYSLWSLVVQDPSIASQEALARIQSTGPFTYIEPNHLQHKPTAP
jgi:hypothetical protein